MDERIRRLVNLEGEYLFGDAVYSLGDNEVPVRAIAAADTIAIRSLVRCLSDDRPSAVTLHARRVTVGRLCAEALVGTSYVQMGMGHHWFPEQWPGYPATTSDSLDLGPVQRAWLQWLHEHRLFWPDAPVSKLGCPPRDSIRAERFRETASADGSGETYVRIRETLADYRYVTYVVDSEFVMLADARPHSAADSTRSHVLDGLAPDDIQSSIIRKSKGEAWKWRACEGVPVVSITTRSKRWRPRLTEPR